MNRKGSYPRDMVALAPDFAKFATPIVDVISLFECVHMRLAGDNE